MRVAIWQTAGVSGSPKTNLEQLQISAARAAAQGAQLLIAPELFLTGYNIGDRIFDLAEPVDGPARKQAERIARQHSIALLFGYPERAGADVFNSALLLDEMGNLLANYRKAHLYGGEEKRLFKPGNALVRAEFAGFIIGLLICYDVEFPEMVRAHALAGCHLIAVPTALMEPQGFVAETLVPARAVENGCFVAYVNRSGTEGDLTYCGLSCVVGPDGRDLGRAGAGEELLVVTLDNDQYESFRAEIPYLRDRRPELY